jgi:DNA-binding CsgD family transcriptional regulator
VADQPGAVDLLLRAVDAARASGDVGTEMLAANNLVVWYEMNGDPALAWTVAEEFVERARHLGLGVWERSFRIALSNLAFHLGDYAHVLAIADELLDMPLETRTREELLEQLCLALVDIGRIDEALGRIDALPDRPDDWTLKRQITWVRCEAALWGGRPERALSLADVVLAGPASDDNIPFAHVSRAWALFDLARDPHPPRPPDPKGYPAILLAVPDEVAGICLLHDGQDAEAVAAFDRAAELWSPYHRRGALRSQWAAGEAAHRAGAADAVDRLLAVEAEAESRGMLPLLARVHRSLRSAGIHRATPRQPRHRGLLSQREREVLRLVATGLTNAEIARRLGLSRHTVVSQIANASLKLGASSRSQAAAMADES